jgi:hypothetical protein
MSLLVSDSIIQAWIIPTSLGTTSLMMTTTVFAAATSQRVNVRVLPVFPYSVIIKSSDYKNKKINHV